MLITSSNSLNSTFISFLVMLITSNDVIFKIWALTSLSSWSLETSWCSGCCCGFSCCLGSSWSCGSSGVVSFFKRVINLMVSLLFFTFLLRFFILLFISSIRDWFEALRHPFLSICILWFVFFLLLDTTSQCNFDDYFIL